MIGSTLSGMLGRLFITHLVYVAAGVAIFSPLLGFMGGILLHFSGQSMLSDMDIAFFVFTPPGMVALVLLAALLITIVVFEQASLMALAAGSVKVRDIDVVSALFFTVSRAREIFLFALHLVVRVLIIVLPFLAV